MKSVFMQVFFGNRLLKKYKQILEICDYVWYNK